MDRQDAKRDRLFAAYAVLASTAVRRSELLGLKWSHIDMDSARLAIVATVVKVGSHTVMRNSQTKTASSRRSIPLDTLTVTILRQHRLQQLEERVAAGAAWQDLDLVFATALGDIVDPDTFTRHFRQLGREAGLPIPKGFGPHALRHGWATYALKAGIHLKVVQERLGHTSITTTGNTYSHLTATMQEDAAQRIAERLLGQIG